MANRQVSILTESQREYLRGERDYSDTSERKKRQRIRDRVRAGIADLALLASTLPETDDFGLVFDDFEDWHEFQQSVDERLERGGRLMMAEPEGAEEGRQMTQNIHGSMAFFYLAVSEYGGGIDGFEGVASTAIEIAETTDKERAEVDVEIELTHNPRPTEVLKKFQSGKEITEDEFQTLVESGELDPVELLRREGVIADE